MWIDELLYDITTSSILHPIVSAVSGHAAGREIQEDIHIMERSDCESGTTGIEYQEVEVHALHTVVRQLDVQQTKSRIFMVIGQSQSHFKTESMLPGTCQILVD
jgi:hypothetical protein